MGVAVGVGMVVGKLVGALEGELVVTMEVGSLDGTGVGATLGETVGGSLGTLDGALVASIVVGTIDGALVVGMELGVLDVGVVVSGGWGVGAREGTVVGIFVDATMTAMTSDTAILPLVGKFSIVLTFCTICANKSDDCVAMELWTFSTVVDGLQDAMVASTLTEPSLNSTMTSSRTKPDVDSTMPSTTLSHKLRNISSVNKLKLILWIVKPTWTTDDRVMDDVGERVGWSGGALVGTLTLVGVPLGMLMGALVGKDAGVAVGVPSLLQYGGTVPQKKSLFPSPWTGHPKPPLSLCSSHNPPHCGMAFQYLQVESATQAL
jgi:hypothetical protein